MKDVIGTSARSPAARTLPMMPMRRKISMVRALQRSIFGRNCGASLRSTSVQPHAGLAQRDGPAPGRPARRRR